MNVANMAGAAMDSIGSGVQKKYKRKLVLKSLKGLQLAPLIQQMVKHLVNFQKA